MIYAGARCFILFRNSENARGVRFMLRWDQIRNGRQGQFADIFATISQEVENIQDVCIFWYFSYSENRLAPINNERAIWYNNSKNDPIRYRIAVWGGRKEKNMLTIEHLVKSYGGDVRAVDDLSIEVLPGDIYGFIGHNGAGKTTTLRAVAGILSFDSGNIRVNGRSITDDPIGCKRDMAYIPDNPDLYDHLTGIQYFNFVADIYGVSNADRDARIKKYADAFEMTPRLNDLIGSCSHGMKQKIALISALLHAPKLLILDEPFVGLDPKAAHTLKGFMKELCDGGSAIFFSTHVLEVAEKLCNKIAIIKQGKLIAAGEMDEVKGNESLETLFLELTDNA